MSSTLIEKFDLLGGDFDLLKPLEELVYFNPVLEEINASISRDTQKLLIPEVIQEHILTIAEETRIARSLCNPINITTDSYTWMRERGFEAVEIEEGSEIPSRRGEYEKFILKVKKIAVRPSITNEMIEDSKWDVMARNLDMATEAMARLEDKKIINTMIMGVPNGSVITSGVGGVGEKVADHYIQMGDEPANGTLSWESIARARVLLRKEFKVPNTMLINPTQMYDLLTGEGDFIGNTERAYMVLPEHIRNAMMTGVIGNIGGMSVIVSSEMTEGMALIFDRSKYMVFAERRPLMVEKFNDILRDMQDIVMTQRFAVGPMDRNSAVLLTGGRRGMFE